MIIREEQMKALDPLGLEGHLTAHMKRFAHDHIESIRQDSLRQFVRLGIQHAARFGWTKRGPVEFFLEMMVMLGSEFHSDPQYPWANASLSRRSDEMSDADRLHAEMMRYYDAVLGPGLCYEVEAIQRVLASDHKRGHQLSGMNESEIASFLEWAYPQKYCFAGPRAMQALRREAEATCTSYKIGMRGLALVTAAFFTFGHGCFSDPQYPWIAACSQLVPARREEALHRIFKKYVKRALSNMESS